MLARIHSISSISLRARSTPSSVIRMPAAPGSVVSSLASHFTSGSVILWFARCVTKPPVEPWQSPPMFVGGPHGRQRYESTSDVMLYLWHIAICALIEDQLAFQSAELFELSQFSWPRSETM
eukprot:COSAG01_NODE_8480_length_2771_cov_1.782934_1_plen_121_part_10